MAGRVTQILHQIFVGVRCHFNGRNPRFQTEAFWYGTCMEPAVFAIKVFFFFKINVYLNLCWPWENLTKRVIQLLGNSSQKRYLLHQKSSMVIVSSKKKGISLELENPGKIHDLSHFDSFCVYTDFLVNRVGSTRNQLKGDLQLCSLRTVTVTWGLGHSRGKSSVQRDAHPSA